MTSKTAFTGGTDEPYITAIQQPYAGYVVSVPRPGIGGKPLRRRFFGHKLSPDQYLEQAKQWRDRVYFMLHGRAVPVRAFHAQQANSSTGVPGVRRQVRRIRSRHDPSIIYEVPVYLAEVWLQPGTEGRPPSGSRSRQFSIAKWGEKTAFEMACEWRRAASAALAQGLSLDSLDREAKVEPRRAKGPER